MSIQELIPYIIIGITGFISYKGFNDRGFFNKYLFHVGAILGQKDYKRMISSGFLHADWIHFGFNMYSLFLFGKFVALPVDKTGVYASGVGYLGFLGIYFGSLIAGNLFALFMNRNNSNYSAIGASGAVSGIVMASVVLLPTIRIMFMPGWIYALVFTGISVFGMNAKRDNIGHDAHLGGGVMGMLLAYLIRPDLLMTNYKPVLYVLVPTLILIFVLIKFPHLLNKDSWARGKMNKPTDTVDEEYNAIKREKELEVNRILEKISSQGVGSLTRDEKNFLDLNT